jgi:hypothetical protein
MSLTKIPASMRSDSDRTYTIDYLIVDPADGSWPLTLSFGKNSVLNWIKVRTESGTVDVEVFVNASPVSFTGPVTAVAASDTVAHYDTVSDNVIGAGTAVTIVLSNETSASFLVITANLEELA